MAKRSKETTVFKGNGKKVTSIGNSKRSRPKNKHKRRNKKRSRGQGSGRR